MNFPVFLICLVFLVFIPPCLSKFDGYTSCGNQFNCGSITDVDYPFWGQDRPYGCGYPGLQLNCDEHDATTIDIMKVKYRVLGINPNTQTLKISREDYLEGICPSQFLNTTLDFTLFDYAPGYMNLTFFYGCSPVSNAIFDSFSPCVVKGFQYKGIYVLSGVHGPGNCTTSVVVPVSQEGMSELGFAFASSSGLDQLLREGFEVKWKVDGKPCSECTKSMGKCGYNLNLNRTSCFCPNQIDGLTTCLPSPAAGAAIPGTTTEEVIQVLNDGFGLVWEANNTACRGCAGSGGTCGSQAGTTEFTCYCPSGPNATMCDGTTQTPADNKKNDVPLGVGLGIAGAGIVGLGLGFLFFRYRQKRKQLDAEVKSKDLPTPPSSKGIPTSTTQFTRSIPSFPSSNTDFAKSNYFGVQVFDYTELEEATDNFDSSRELGDGGFGTVYYGNLLDGRVVAVKRLYENNFKRVEQFMNEVEILTRLRHKNLVVLFGCTSRKSRELLLVYEYIPNGTVADHLHGSKANSGLLTWSVRLSIAIETADALAYLHASDIIHRDVKTNNILLDNDFRVKVADFGLSRLFPTDVTHVSTAPQGTPGYVDPEYYQCYQLTDKSDVYSFGVVLMELISSKPAVDTNRHRHDINLANMAVNKIQNHTLHELVEPSLGFETDYVVKRMTTAVAELAFRCLQQEKDMRPSMEEVLEGLRAIQNEDFSVQKAEVVDIRVDEDARLLKNIPNPPPLSPDSAGTDKWVSSSTAPNSF